MIGFARARYSCPVAVVLVALFSAAHLDVVHSAQFIVEDVVVSDPGDSLVDPEFDKNHSSFRMAWQEENGDLWVVEGSAVDGTWDPADGRQILLDYDLLPVGESRQGPEWAYDNRGNRILYTRMIDSESYQIFQAWQDPISGLYLTAPLVGGEGRFVGAASHTPGDPFPRITYTGIEPESGKRYTGWREIDVPATDRRLPDDFGNKSWVEGKRGIIGTMPIGGRSQIVYHDVDTSVTTQLTSDAGDKRFPLMWRDPCTKQYIVVATINDRRIGVWVQDNRGQWVLAARSRPPTELPYLFKPDYFLWEDVSYVAYHAHTENSGKDQNRRGEGEVWLTRICLDEPLRHRKLNDPSVTRIKDVENFPATSRPYAYYAEILDDGRRLIHRVDTGLHIGD